MYEPLLRDANDTASPSLPLSPLIADNTAVASVHDDDADVKFRPSFDETYKHIGLRPSQGRPCRECRTDRDSRATPATAPVSTTATPSLTPPRTLNDGIVISIFNTLKVAIITASTAMLLQTPGAGPSTLGTAGRHGSSSTTTISDAKGEIIVKTSFALSSQRTSGTTRPGSANPLSARDGLCGRGSRKGKEKEIVDVHYSDAQIQVDSEDSKPSSIPNLLPLLAIVNFADLLDEVIFKFVSNTSSILQELSPAVSARAGSLVFTASGHIGHAKVTLLRYSSLVRFGAEILARHVKNYAGWGGNGSTPLRLGTSKQL
ncbi:hypothetical protein FRC00_001850 [Tulasnella sp. 408]|nr:hypothetical protein FRC00_001850 [Tulasnella sp. 408]